MAREYLLVLNAGSSSLKFAVHERTGPQAWKDADRGQVAGTGNPALRALLERLRERLDGGRVAGVGHRVVHGGPRYAGPVVITPEVLAELRELAVLAPLHQPHSLAAIDALADRMPGVPQVACFDTSFHRELPPVAEVLPLPREIREAGLRRYGFHGISCDYIASVLPQVAPAVARGRVIIAHLGSGASLCALRDGRSIDTTFGFSPLDGLCMGTRPGTLDPGVILYLFKTLGFSPGQVEDLLYTRSGLLGISGISSDMRDLLASQDPAAKLAVDYFVYRAAREIGALAAVLGGLDALVFTGGMGENSAEIRARITVASAWLGIGLDADANQAGGPCISAPASRVSAWVIPTNEELLIAGQTRLLLGLG